MTPVRKSVIMCADPACRRLTVILWVPEPSQADGARICPFCRHEAQPVDAEQTHLAPTEAAEPGEALRAVMPWALSGRER